MSTIEVPNEAAEAETAADRVFAKIYHLILHSKLLPGQIVKESELSERFGVSRGPVREAVNRLRGLGLLDKQAYARARVSELTLKTVFEIFQLREMVEGLSARLAARNASDEDIERLLSDFEASRENDDTEFDLHARLARISGNSYVERLFCDELNYQIQRYRIMSGKTGRRTQAYNEHWQILRAIASRDEELAESLMRSHIARAVAQLENVLADKVGTNGGPND